MMLSERSWGDTILHGLKIVDAKFAVARDQSATPPTRQPLNQGRYHVPMLPFEGSSHEMSWQDC